ncbi:UPF0406 family protein [Heterostelium album PN500]|uniref:U6 snRNA phosphodiesterase 1 n=1 Tax=Heterostelium pallidum (strain ATCC 26659 / Pp 5 / PN500) TaxID=670386 RepID=D3BF01_HETP5|nr:UPF0406 family protein [Heterostelium album PN500]EFA80482.1 UPF0406 family protein [Heterostelium album PN500]|eukprot:XP_020432602.1 UPF0406 family protein [Heterostelium album PN500]
MDLIFQYESGDERSSSDSEEEEKSCSKVVKKIKIDKIDNNKVVSTADEIPDLPDDLFPESIKEELVLDNGKKRLFEHVDGNYPTYVYVKIPTSDDINAMIEEVGSIAKEHDVLEVVDDYHVSLSRVFTMREHHIDTFTSEMTTKLKNIKEFTINFETISTFVNDGQSRLFFSANVCRNVDKLNDTIKKIDQVLKQFKFPVFYETPLPHLSVNWKAIEPTDPLVINPIKDMPLKHSTKSTIVDTIYWKIGKYEFFVNLNKQ